MKKEDRQLFSKILGCELAGAIGNAIGDKVEGRTYQYIEQTYGVLDRFVVGHEEYIYIRNDDTYDMFRYEHDRAPASTEDGFERHKLCGAAVIRKGGRISIDDLAETIARKIDPTKFGYLLGWQDQFLYYSIRAGMKPVEIGEFASWPGKIGTTKMIMPIGMINAGQPEKAYEDAWNCARIKDSVGEEWNHGVEVAAVVAAAVAEALKPDATVESVIEKVLSLCSERLKKQCIIMLEKAKTVKDWKDIREFYAQTYEGKNISMADEILATSLAVFYLAKGNPAEAIIIASNLGRDTDCKAYVAGGLAGALSGVETLPESWIREVEQYVQIDPYTLSRQTCWERANIFYRLVMEARGIKMEDPPNTIDGIIKEKLNKPADYVLTDKDYESIVSLDASNRKIRSIEGIQKLKNLEWLNLDNNEISDISPLSSLTKLIHLDLGMNRISDIQALKGMKNLKSLLLDNNNISDISPLKELTQIRFLNLSNNKITDITPLEGYKNLYALILDNNYINDITPIQNNLNLTSLGLNNNNVQDISILANFRKLIALYLRNNKIVDVTPLSCLGQEMKCLVLDDNMISDASPLGNLHRLIHLSISRNPLRSLDFIKNLRHLNFLEIDGVGATFLDIPKSLKHLSAADNKLKDVTFLEGNEKVQYINLTTNEVNQVEGACKLHYLDLRNNNINNIEPIRKLKGLKYLYLKGNPIEDTSILNGLPMLMEKDF